MAKPPPLVATPSGELPIDRALGLAAAGDSEGALRWAVPLAKTDLAVAQPLFSSLAAPALRALVSAFEVRLFDKGDKIIEEGTPGAEAFVLARGELEVFRDQAGEPLLLARLGSGAVFGEMALLSRSPRAA